MKKEQKKSCLIDIYCLFTLFQKLKLSGTGNTDAPWRTSISFLLISFRLTVIRYKPTINSILIDTAPQSHGGCWIKVQPCLVLSAFPFCSAAVGTQEFAGSHVGSSASHRVGAFNFADHQRQTNPSIINAPACCWVNESITVYQLAASDALKW